MKRLLKILMLFLALPGQNHTYAQNITTVAGNGYSTESGDGGPALYASLFYSVSLAPDKSGGFFIGGFEYDYNYTGGWGLPSWSADIRWVNNSGIINTYAGNGIKGFSGDGGPATDAEIAGKGAITSDAAGNLYISDWVNNRIRKVDTTGIITTIAGNGTTSYTGDGGPATAAGLGSSDSVLITSSNITSDPYGNIYIYIYRVTGKYGK